MGCSGYSVLGRFGFIGFRVWAVGSSFRTSTGFGVALKGASSYEVSYCEVYSGLDDVS